MTNVIITTRNRLRLLEQTLVTLYANTDRDDFNLTIVDDCSDDFRCLSLLDMYGTKSNCTVLYLKQTAHVLSRLKNIGVLWSEQTFGRGDYLYISDNDVCFTPGWLPKLRDLYKGVYLHGFRLLGGQVHTFHKPINCTSDNPLRSAIHKEVVREHALLDGLSWFMQWNLWDDVGPLKRDTAAGVCQSEDTVFCNAVRSMGHRIGAVDPPLVLHCGLTNSDGKPAPGYEERKKQLPKGVYTE